MVQQANSIFHLFDKQFNDQLMPLIRSVLGQRLKSYCIYPTASRSYTATTFHLFIILLIFTSNICVSSSSPKLAECLHKKKEVIEQMEVKLDTGIDRSVYTEVKNKQKQLIV